MRVLLIADSAEAPPLEAALSRAQRFRAEVVHSQSASDAASLLAHDRFDVILLDLTLSGVSGILAIDTLRTAAPALPIVVLTAPGGDSLPVEALRAGAQQYLVKDHASTALLESSILYAIERKQNEEASHRSGQKRAEESLKEREEQYRLIFEATSDGLVINDMSGVAVEVNPAFCEMHGYAREELIGMDLATLHPPESEPVYWEYLDTARDGRVFMTQGQHIHLRKDGTPFYVEVHGTSFAYKGEPHILGVVRDVTERVRAYDLLEQRVDERTRELSTLLEVSNNVASTLALEPLLSKILHEVKQIVDSEAAFILVRVGDDLKIYDSRFTPIPEQVIRGEQSPLENLGAIWKTLERGEAVIIPDVRGDTPMALEMQAAAGPLLDAEFADMCSWLAVPLALKGHVAGLLAVSHPEPDFYRPEHVRLATAIAGQAGVAIENARLYEEAQKTARITTALAQTASRVAFGGTLKDTLDDISRHVVTATGAVASAVVLFGPEATELREAHMAGSYGLPADYVAAVNKVLASGGPMESVQALLRREVSIVPRLNQRLFDTLEKFPEYEAVLRFVQSEGFETFVSVPMVYGDNLVGGLIGYYPRHRDIDDGLLAFQAAIADQTAVAIGNARLYDQTQKTARSTAALAQIASRVAFGGSLESTLDDISRHVVDATGAVASAVVLIDPDSEEQRMVGTCGLPEGYAAAATEVLASRTLLFAQDAFDGEKPVLVRDMRKRILDSLPSAPLHRFMHVVPWDTLVAAPMVYRDKRMGTLLSYHPAGRAIEESDLAFHAAIADQTAVAVENARLLAQVQEKAALEQRQHLARELHDSVSQALFSINLTARGIESTVQREAPKAANVLTKVGDLRQLTQGALAEMRALIFELRPGALEEEGLVQALRKHAAAVQGRELLQVDVTYLGAGEMPRLKPAAEEALYRIAQEALHNVVKHAKATEVEIALGVQDECAALCVKDNGVGFDPTKVPAGHMGLGTMGQRAVALGGHYSIESKRGSGTTINVRIPLAQWQMEP
jgi:PAS domain S-box-containing protein